MKPSSQKELRQLLHCAVETTATLWIFSKREIKAQMNLRQKLAWLCCFNHFLQINSNLRKLIHILFKLVEFSRLSGWAFFPSGILMIFFFPPRSFLYIMPFVKFCMTKSLQKNIHFPNTSLYLSVRFFYLFFRGSSRFHQLFDSNSDHDGSVPRLLLDVKPALFLV